MAVQKKLYTLDEFEAFTTRPENRDRQFELINGEIVEKMPTQEHGIIALNIGAEIRAYIRAVGSGRVGVEIRHRLPGDEHNARQPDIAYYADNETPIVERGAVPHMPDLAVEVKSPDDTYNEMREKADYYLANGARMVWLVYPEKRLVEVRHHDADTQFVTEEESIEGGNILPGFTLAVRDILS